MRNEIFEKNFQSLNDRYPEWNLDIDVKKEQEKNIEIEIEQEYSYSDEKITAVIKGEKKYYLAGKYNPNQMAEIQAHLLKEKKARLQFFIGMGDGRLLREYIKLKEEEDYCIIYEPSWDIFYHMIQTYEFGDLFEDEKCIWLVEKINSKYFQDYMDQIMTLENMLNINIYIQNNYEKLFPRQIESIMKKIHYGVQKTECNWTTLIHFKRTLTQNNILNFKYLCKHCNSFDLADQLSENIPAIVVGAGPSLDKNIAQLKEAKGKACIIACDTALKPLIREGITPDLFVVVDAEKPLELFEDEKIWSVPMVSNINIPYEIMKKHVGKKFLFDNLGITQAVLKNISKDGSQFPPISTIHTGGSVANDAFSIAKAMGAKNIILIGMDLANTGGKIHASGTLQQEAEENYNREIWVESIDGDMIPTLPQFKHYLKWFEQQIEEDEDIHVVDATEGGALIHGSEVITLNEAIQKYCKKEFSITEQIENIPPHLSEAEQLQLKEVYKDMPTTLRKLRKQAIKIKENYVKLEKLAKTKSIENTEIRKVVRKLATLNKQLEENYMWKILKYANAQEDFTMLIHVNKVEDVEDEMKSLRHDADLGKEYIEKLILNIDEFAPFIQEVAQYYKNAK